MITLQNGQTPAAEAICTLHKRQTAGDEVNSIGWHAELDDSVETCEVIFGEVHFLESEIGQSKQHLLGVYMVRPNPKIDLLGKPR